MKPMTVVLALSLSMSAFLSGPAHAVSSIADVPSFWPQEGAFKSKEVDPVIATKGAIVWDTFEDDQTRDR